MAERVLSAQDRKYGTGYPADPVFFVYSDTISELLFLHRHSELEEQLQTFGSHLKPYVRERAVDAAMFLWPEKHAVDCSVCLAFHPIEGGTGVMVERYTFSSLREFLYVELGKALLKSNAPRQCRLCGHWFLHEQGARMMYCSRIAPWEDERTCREI